MHYKIAITKMKTEFMKNNVFIINIQILIQTMILSQ